MGSEMCIRDSYYSDSIENSETKDTPEIIESPANLGDKSKKSVTFFPSLDSDYFKCTLPTGSYKIYTDNSFNGALCGIRIYDATFQNIILANDPSSFASPYNTNASVDVSVTIPKEYGIEVFRFTSNITNFGPQNDPFDISGASITQYKQTAGRYGSYDLIIENVLATPASTTTGGGGGNGCFLGHQ